LLSRTTRSVKLTDIGASYHREVAPAFDALQGAEAHVRQLQAHPSGRLCITAPVELEVSLLDRVVNLVDEGFDLAIRVGPLSNSGLIVRTLSDPQPLGVFASPAYLRRHGPLKHPHDLGTHRCLAMGSAQNPTAWSFVIDGRPRTVNVTPHVMINSFQVVRALATAGVEVARLPMRHAAPGLASGQLKQLLKSFAPPSRSVLAVYPSNRNISPARRAMIDVFVQCFERHPPLGSTNSMPG